MKKLQKSMLKTGVYRGSARNFRLQNRKAIKKLKVTDNYFIQQENLVLMAQERLN